MIYTDRTQLDSLLCILLADGRKLSVYDGEESTILKCATLDHVREACATTDMNELEVWDANDTRLGWILLVYGNGPGELVADYTARAELESLIDAWHAEVEG